MTLRISLFFICGLLLSGCQKKSVNINSLIQEGDLFISPQTYKPYSGAIFSLHPDGKNISLKGSLKNGNPDGQWVSYYPDGKTAEIRNFDNGKLNGPWLKYFDNGKVSEEINFTAGKLDGRWVTFNRNGTVEGERYYVNGAFVGSEAPE